LVIPLDAEDVFMNVSRNRAFIALFVVVAVVHFCLSWVAFMKSELIKPNEATHVWRMASEVLAFPLVYLANSATAIDLFPVLMIANSLLWGGFVALVVRQLARLSA
jgi:hypothetical protein